MPSIKPITVVISAFLILSVSSIIVWASLFSVEPSVEPINEKAFLAPQQIPKILKTDTEGLNSIWVDDKKLSMLVSLFTKQIPQLRASAVLNNDEAKIRWSYELFPEANRSFINGIVTFDEDIIRKRIKKLSIAGINLSRYFSNLLWGYAINQLIPDHDLDHILSYVTNWTVPHFSQK
jgi:hypothetical protein